MIRLERARYSILTDDLEHCYICGYPKEDMHEVYGGANRRMSMENGLCVPLCRHYHIQITVNDTMNKALKRVCQKKYEETHTRDEFMSLIKKNYLED